MVQATAFNGFGSGDAPFALPRAAPRGARAFKAGLPRQGAPLTA